MFGQALRDRRRKGTATMGWKTFMSLLLALCMALTLLSVQAFAASEADLHLDPVRVQRIAVLRCQSEAHGIAASVHRGIEKVPDDVPAFFVPKIK